MIRVSDIPQMISGLRRCPESVIRLIPVLALFLAGCASTFATNIVTYTVTDSVPGLSDELILTLRSLSNEDDRTRISFDILSSNAPFTIYRAEWINCDTIRTPTEPFSLIANADEVTHKNTVWHISIDFPFSQRFDDSDLLILYTDKGTIRFLISEVGQLKESIDILRHDYERDTRRAWTILGGVICIALIIGLATFIIIRRRFIRKRLRIDELSMMVAERADMNLELRNKINTLYGSRLDTLNMLCNEYFEKHDSEKLRLTLYNEVEKHILALRDPKSISELEILVNSYLDNILDRIKEQIPSLNRNDLIFLTYLFAGFSPRAVCIFTDIKIKNFYNRRSRLKERILASEAPDREFFVSRM
ncbi:MAG: hypothetical protein K2M19_05525 [Muribaculaceae bacterium]|nr:hypothetical protein [Muribaculaceae bacterium]